MSRLIFRYSRGGVKWSTRHRIVYQECRREGVAVRVVAVLTVVDREGISRGLVKGWTSRAIGRDIGRHHGVVAAEIARNGGREVCRAVAAQDRAVALRGRPKERKLLACAVLHDTVNAGLARSWSRRTEPRATGSRRLNTPSSTICVTRLNHCQRAASGSGGPTACVTGRSVVFRWL
jgi:Helix-turn-helix domain